MTLQQIHNEIEHEILIDKVKIGEEYIPHVATLTYESNYLQIIYDYGIKIIWTILKVLERNEFYEQCLVLTQAIQDYNKKNGTSHATHYKSD